MMKKLIFLLLLAAFLLSTCSIHLLTEPEPEVTEPPSPAPVASAVPEPSPKPENRLPEGYTAEQIADYFCEVALGEEYAQGDEGSNAVQKWLQPIYYVVHGQPSAEDEEVLTAFVDELNQLEGFPGMYPAESSQQKNCSIRFLDRDQMNSEAGHVVKGEYVDGISQWYYYTESNELHTMNIWICTEIDQRMRNSVILEEIVNSIGLGNDTLARTDSIIYQGYSDVQQLSEIDWLIIQILYSEKMHCGMTEAQCREVINQMYEM